MISPVRLIPPSLGAGGVAASPGSAAPAAAKGSHMGATGVAPGAWAQCTTLVCSYSRTVYLRDYSGKIHMSRHQVLKTLHSSLSVRCDELHLVLLRSCDYISSCAQRLNAGRNQGHVKVVSGARNASFVHTVTVLTLCVSKTPRNSSNAFSVHPRSSVLVPFGAQSLIAIPASSCAALAPPGCRSISAICPLMPQYRLLFAPHLKECR